MKTLEGRWALVTGSSRGIGRQIALALAERKCNVVVHGRTIENARKTQEELKRFGVKTHAVEGELSSEAGVDRVIQATRNGAGPIDILYNNAGVQSVWKPIWDFTEQEWLDLFRVNLFAMVRLCNAFAPGMRDRKWGRIVNVSSGIRDQPSLTPYSVSKAAVDKYSRDLAWELKDTGVLVNYLDPGWLRTDLGGPNADHPVETVLPGALVPVLLDDNGPTGRLYAAQDYAMLS